MELEDFHILRSKLMVVIVERHTKTVFVNIVWVYVVYLLDSVDFFISQFKLQGRSDYYHSRYKVALGDMTVWDWLAWFWMV